MKQVSVAIVGMGGCGRNTYGRMMSKIEGAYIAAKESRLAGGMPFEVE